MMTFSISIGRWGGFYWHRDYTARLCLGWVAFTFFPFDIDDHFNAHLDTVCQLSDTIDCLSRQLKQMGRVQP